MPKAVKKYTDSLNESLKDPKEAAAYLNTHLEDNDSDSEELFLMALRDVAKAYGVADVAEKAQLGRESLYKALSSDGNPKLATLRSLLKAMGLKLSVEIDEAS
jgi:probable addiction module antidote protein